MKILSTIILLLISINIAQAEEGIIPKLLEYDVEVIIFEDAHARYINSEDWNQDDKLEPAITDTVEPEENPDKLSVKEIKSTSYKNIKPGILNQEYKRINGSKEYNVLFYGSWRQTGLDEKNAFEIDIEELENTHNATSKNTITGNFKLVLARYLHIYGELEYQRNMEGTSAEKPVTNNELEEQVTESTTDESALENNAYPITIHRRMRSKEIHYIDHPLVGMLIQINPVEVSTEENAEKPAAP